MIRFGWLMELSAGPLMLCIKFSTNACSTPQPRDLHNSKPQRCSPHLVADPSPLILSGPAHLLVLGAIHDGCPIQVFNTIMAPKARNEEDGGGLLSSGILHPHTAARTRQQWYAVLASSDLSKNIISSMQCTMYRNFSLGAPV